MSNPWTPEHEVDATAAMRLIAEQFPRLASLKAEPYGIGWDNVVYRVGPELAFRFPLRAAALEGVEREIAWLPRLEAAELPVPRLRFTGRPSGDYRWPFFGYEIIEGVETCELGLNDSQRAALARPLGRFLAKLHSPELSALAEREGLPVDPIGRLDMQRRALMTRERMVKIRALGVRLGYERLELLLAAAERLPRPPATALVHGDLHFRHVIVRPDASFSGVIDWGDLHRNSPAVDLQLAYSFLPPAVRGEFWDEYGSRIDEATLVVTRAFAVFLNVALLFYAVSEKLPRIQAEAELALSWI